MIIKYMVVFSIRVRRNMQCLETRNSLVGSAVGPAAGHIVDHVVGVVVIVGIVA